MNCKHCFLQLRAIMAVTFDSIIEKLEYYIVVTYVLLLTYANESKEYSNKDKLHYSSTIIECIIYGTYRDMENYYSMQLVLLLYNLGNK